jgi:hypothetical protein
MQIMHNRSLIHPWQPSLPPSGPRWEAPLPGQGELLSTELSMSEWRMGRLDM